jgi:hypothetical protein
VVHRLLVQKIQRRPGIVARAGDRLCDFVSQRGSQFSHHAQTVHVREICLQLAESFPLLLRAFAFRHIDVCPDNLGEVSACGEKIMARRFKMFDRSIRQRDSKFNHVAGLCAAVPERPRDRG